MKVIDRIRTDIKTTFSRTCKNQILGFSRTQKRVFKTCCDDGKQRSERAAHI